MTKKILLALGITTMTLTAAACNTVRGAGDDLQSAANTVDDATCGASKTPHENARPTGGRFHIQPQRRVGPEPAEAGRCDRPARYPTQE